MKKLGLLTMAITLTSLGTALANLPDEINYSPYENQYQTLSANVDRITSQLNLAEDDLSSAYEDEQQISSSIINLEVDNRELAIELDNSIRDLSAIKQREINLEDKINQLTRRLEKLTRQERQLSRDIKREDARLNPIRKRLQAAKENAKRSKRQLESAKSELANKRSKLQAEKTALASLRSKKQTLQSQLEKQKKQLATIDSQIASLEAKKASLPGKIKAANNTAKKEQDKHAQIQQEFTAQRTEITTLMRANRADPRLVELRRALNVKARALQNQDKVAKRAVVIAKKLKSEEQALGKNIAKLKAGKGKLPAQIQRTKSSIASSQSSIDTKKVAVDRTQAIVDKSQNEVAKVEQVHTELKIKIDRVSSNLLREAQGLKELKAQRKEVESKRSDVSQRSQARGHELTKTRDQIRTLGRHIPELRTSLRSNESRITKLENDLIVTRDDIVVFNRSVNSLSLDQQTAVIKRDSKYQEYLGRFNLYNEKLGLAKELGASQTDSANELAINISNTYVQKRSSSLGNSMGEKQASVEGNFWGSVRAELKGHADGYQQGLASQDDISRGESEGSSAGVQDANSYASSVLKPQFFSEFFAADLSQSAVKMNESLAQAALTLETENIELGLSKSFNFSNSIEPVTNSELSQSRNTITPLDSVIISFQESYLQTSSEVQDLSKPQNAFEVPKDIPFGNPNCGSVYKNVAEFKSACSRAYKSKFESLFKNVYYDNFRSQYQQMYSQKLEATRDALVESKYSDAFNTHFNTAKNQGVTDGKRDIYAKTYARAKKMAYNNQLPIATSNSRLEARGEVTDWIKANATLKVNGARIEGNQLRGSSKAKLVLSLKNISPQDLASPVKVNITSVQNAVVSQRQYFIKVAPGMKNSEFREIEFAVDSRARSNQEVRISGEVVLSGGKYQSQRVEKFTASAVTVVNPAISSNLVFDATPKVVTSFRRRTLIHNLDTSISPSVESVANGYTVNFKAAPGYVGMIQFKNTSFRTAGLNYGRSQNIRFQYTFPRSSENKLVKALVTYSYLGEVIKTDIVEFRPH